MDRQVVLMTNIGVLDISLLITFNETLTGKTIYQLCRHATPYKLALQLVLRAHMKSHS